MLSFLEETLLEIERTNQDISNATFVLPSKRAGGFLKNYLRRKSSVSQFLPKIISIEELIQDLSGLEIIDTTELLFRSYDVYKSSTEFSDHDTFDEYAGWATTLLNDFNEVDRYLVDTNHFFDYLGNIKSLERWNVTSHKTKFIENYVAFWNSLPTFYSKLKTTLLQNGIAYQGLVYREAVSAIEHYLLSNKKKHYFIGFNALNTSEQHLIQAFLETEQAEIFWDAEKAFVEDKQHSASLFFRRYLKDWKHFQQNPPKFISTNFSEPKKIDIVSCQKNSSQIKYIGQLLASYSEEKLNNTAIVLADEVLLLPLLHSLPKNVVRANVTMGASIKNFPTTVFFESWLSLHYKNNTRHYYKDIIAILAHPLSSKLIDSRPLITVISKANRSHYTLSDLNSIVKQEDRHIIQLLFGGLENSPSKALSVCHELVQSLKKITNKQSIDHVVLFELFGIFQKLQNLDTTFSHLASLVALQELFLELIAVTSIDFKGDAYEGLQIMGVLETRVLDFENIIILSVNEGVFPAGKSNSSFITYDLKKEFNLPLFTEKDAIYTYHFYHMLHRAQEITLCHTDFTEGLNSGEKSRFLLQLEIETQEQHTITKFQVAPSMAIIPKTTKTFKKTKTVLDRIQEIALKGFSPSALTSYVRNPVEFYYQKILKIQEEDIVEETVAFNTLGTIVHDSLQQLYEPYISKELTIPILKEIKEKVTPEVITQFKRSFVEGDISKGKNLIIFEVIKRYVTNAIDLDVLALKQGNTIQLLHVESNLKVPLEIPELNFPVYVHGQVDRIDKYNGEIRIIDYKTGAVYKGDLELMHWDTLRTDYKYSKAFQVLAYALMMYHNTPFEKAQAGIISFKNLGSGFLPFATKDSPRGKKDVAITKEILSLFEEQLKRLILEICNPEFPFIEKEIE